MADSQPGSVSPFDPAIVLEDFTTLHKDKLLYNENQIVLAKLKDTRPTSSWATVGGVKYEDYKNKNGEYVYIDSLYYDYYPTGVLPANIEDIVLVYDEPVLPTEITFWSKDSIANGEVIIRYSNTGGPTWSGGYAALTSYFDASIPVFEGESPTTGQYVNTIQIFAPVSARYWQLDGTAANVLDSITEIKPATGDGFKISHWNSDGVKAVTHQLDGSGYYDITYDKADDAYYAIRFDSDLPTTATAVPNDNFDGATLGPNFDSLKWKKDYGYFIRGQALGNIEMSSTAGPGYLNSVYGIDGDYKCNIVLTNVVTLNTNSYFSVQASTREDNNTNILSGIKGPYIPGVDTSGKFVGATVTYTSSVGSAALLRDFTIKGEGLDFNSAGGNVNYSFIYDASINAYTVTEDGVAKPDCLPGVFYDSLTTASFNIAHLYAPFTGQGFTVEITCSENAILGTATSGISLEMERIGTNGYVRHEDTNVGGFINNMNGNVSDDTFTLSVYGDSAGSAVELSADTFVVTSGTVIYDSPVFSVVTIDKSGNPVQVSSVSDVDGYAIKSLDIIRDSVAKYGDFLYPKVGIATNGLLHNAGGEVYIKVNDTIYKYLKSALPIVQEDGSGSSLTVSGSIPATGIKNFSYSGYTNGGLSYIKYEPVLTSVFLKTISTTTLLPTEFKSSLNVAESINMFCWNVLDGSTLYYADSIGNLKLFDLDETKARFVSLTSDKQVLSAGTAETANITAQVLNVYGEPKTAKTVSFSVSAGDGAISPPVTCSDALGKAVTVYTVGSAVGTTTITVSVSDITCTP